MLISGLTDEEKEKMKKAWFAYNKEMKANYPNIICRLVDFIAGYRAALSSIRKEV